MKKSFKEPPQPERPSRFRLPEESVGGDGSTIQCFPSFSLTKIQPSHCLSSCNQEEKAAFADTLHKLSKLKWIEIMNSPRHGCGTEKISRCSIRVPIPAFVTEDTNLLAFRFCGKAPFVGFRKDEIFYVLWLDRVFTLYEH